MKALTILLALPLLSFGQKISIFDGKTLNGWDVRQGEEQWWTARDGMIVGGSLKQKVPRNTFLATKKSYENFELEFDVRLVKGSGFMNSGIQVRSIRIPNNSEMKGYQVDAGIGWWGKIYDESRRNKVIAEPVDPAALVKTAKDWDWNHYRILCEGPRIRSWINGTPALDFTERAIGIPQDGLIGFQAHGGGAFEVQFKNITIKELPATPGSPKWAGSGKKTTLKSPIPPEKAASSFQLAPGFTAELVASEKEGVGKPITVSWDSAGRMWTTTAYEYPVDANENRKYAEELYARGGRDKVLVFDNCYGPGPHTPRVFAEGLAIPLGVLPWENGAIVQYGDSIRHYFDSDSDGKSDGFRTLLTGFGIQDSHLFPHQFERMPGGWISVAQGLFNKSLVKRPNNQSFINGQTAIAFNQCKLGRMRPDGSEFELLTAGPNNIWGFSQTRDGRTFLQEANDLGIPLAEFEPGTHYRTGSQEKLRPYAPQIPPSLTKTQMGGTGLSGLALVEDHDSPFQMAYDGEVFIVVNPITNRLQIITVKTNEKGQYLYQKQEDFLISSDKWFRPIAAHFGPDGCLYVVDWYNKVISHNEVPRAHPDRDKTHGRIWRIRHHSQKSVAPPNLAKMSSPEVIKHLGHANALISRLAWHELSDRKDAKSIPSLESIVTDKDASVARRCAALWALEGMKQIKEPILVTLAKAKHPSLRYEAIRAAGEHNLPEASFLALAKNADFKSHRRTRVALANAIRDHRAPTPAMMALVTSLGDAPLTTGGWDQYDREFERYLARWALEHHSKLTTPMLEAHGSSLSSEQFLLAIQSLEPAAAAAQLVRAIPGLKRPLSSGELSLLGSQLQNPDVKDGLNTILSDPGKRLSLLRTFESLDAALAADPALAQLVEKASLDAFPDASPENQQLILRLGQKFRLKGLEPVITKWLAQPKLKAKDSLIGLAALRELGSTNRALFEKYYRSTDAALRRESLIALAALPDPDVVTLVAKDWDKLPGDLRQLAIHGLTSQKEKTLALAKAAANGQFKGLTADSLGSIVVLLGADHPDVKQLLKNTPGLLQPVINFTGNDADSIDVPVTLTGPFTVECWVKLAPGIDNFDSLLGSPPRGPDINFFGKTFRLYAGANAGGDRIVASRPMTANLWTHCAITRDQQGVFKIYLDGALDPAKSNPYTGPLKNMKVGQSIVPGGSTMQIREYRIWDRERTAQEIRDDFQTSYTGVKPAGLVYHFDAGSPNLKLGGKASVILVDDAPKLVNPAAAKAAKEKFQKFLTLANRNGNATKGRALFATCLACHKVGNAGGVIGPDLSGAGAMSTEALLHNILTPNAQMESGYYRHDLILKNGSKISGSLVKETKSALSIQPVGTALQVVPRGQIAQHKVTKSSLMPEGLIDHLSSEQVTDLFTYLRTLK